MIHFLVLNKVYAKASESGVRMLQMGMAVNKRTKRGQAYN